MSDRVVLFIDLQNTYRGARDAFFTHPASYIDGQFDPIAIGNLICDRAPAGFNRVLHEVRVYTGRPDSSKNPKGYAAHMRQCAAWEAQGVKVVARALRYPPDYPDRKPEEKGIDVQLAVEFIAGAIEGAYDVGIIFSTDTDLRPALEYVAGKFPISPRAEVAAWRSPTSNRALTLSGSRRLWCHYLGLADYQAVQDIRDYNLP
jgi:uncharacterized LabA/DUF88 family protein